MEFFEEVLPNMMGFLVPAIIVLIVIIVVVRNIRIVP